MSPFSWRSSRPCCLRKPLTSMLPSCCCMSPCSVMMPWISEEGVTSNAGFQTCITSALSPTAQGYQLTLICKAADAIMCVLEGSAGLQTDWQKARLAVAYMYVGCSYLLPLVVRDFRRVAFLDGYQGALRQAWVHCCGGGRYVEGNAAHMHHNLSQSTHTPLLSELTECCFACTHQSCRGVAGMVRA